MKCALRLGEEFHALDDVPFLPRCLDIRAAGEALEVGSRCFDESLLRPKTRLALEERLPERGSPRRLSGSPARLEATRRL